MPCMATAASPPPLPRCGAANLEWRSVPEEHLWAHPFAIPLPPTGENVHDISPRWVHQRHPAWSSLRAGALTSSFASAVCGLHERTLASRACTFPKHLTSHAFAVEAWHHLRGATHARPSCASSSCACSPARDHPTPLIHTPDHAAHVIDMVGVAEARLPLPRPCNELWTESTHPCHAFKYTYVCGHAQSCELRDMHALRLAWGRVHEATGLLALLNALHGQGRHSTRLLQCGVCTCDSSWLTGVSDAADRAVLPVLRATPDAVILHDGAVRVVEVKCTAPFTAVRGGDFALNCESHVRGRAAGLVPPHIVPQVQLQMLCVGPRCDGAYVVHVTATRGCRIAFLPRDDDFIAAMLTRVAAFMRAYVHPGVQPREDFSSDVYGKAFVDACARAALRATLVANVPHEHVQRAAPDFVPLLLERR